MKKYFYAEGETQNGPFSLDELRDKKISKSTLVWTYGMDVWKEAQSIPELVEIIVVSPPPINKEVPKPPPIQKPDVTDAKPQDQTSVRSEKSVPPKKKSPVGWIIGITVTCTLAVLIFINRDRLFGSGGSGGGGGYTPDPSTPYEEQVKSVQEIEEETPTNFLSAGGEYRTNLLGDKLVISGNITSTATAATYKDPTITVYYYSKTKTLLKTADFVVYEVIKPNSTKYFEERVTNYSDVSTIGWEVTAALVN